MNLDEMESAPASFDDVIVAENNDPLAQIALDVLLATNSDNPTCLLRGETNAVEYKESFNSSALPTYVRTMAAFANTRGGYIVFGVSDSSHEVKGLTNDAFDRFDPERITDSLNNLFSPKLSYRKHGATVAGKKVGILYIYPSLVKPVIAKSTHGSEVREGEVYYRYEGRTEKIKYPEMRSIIDDQRRRETELWLKYMTKIAKIGIENTVIVDSNSGVITGSGEKTILLDEEQLSKLNIVHEGRIHESEGAPALKLLENAQEVPLGFIQRTEVTTKLVEVPVETEVEIALRTHTIIEAFLFQKSVSKPELYIEQICYAEAAFLPVYYFAKLAKIKLNDVVAIIQATKPTVSQRKDTLLRRLSSTREHFSKASPAEVPSPKAEFYQAIVGKTLTHEIDKSDVVTVLNTIRGLIAGEIDIPYLFPLVFALYEQFYTDRSIRSGADTFRRTLCHLDCVLFQDDVRPFEDDVNYRI